MKRTEIRRSTPLRRDTGEARLTVPIPKPRKPRACKVCKEKFEPERAMQRVCSGLCGMAAAKEKRAKELAAARALDRKLTREAKLALKPRSFWLKRAEQQVNRYVRLAAIGDGCISCNKPASWDGQWHASHFRSVGAASGLRFHLWNIKKACSPCNKWLSGNIAEYEPRLRAAIGDEKVNWLKSQNTPRTYEIDYLKRLRDVFARKCARLQKRIDIEPPQSAA